jgi:hypothetical protein
MHGPSLRLPIGGGMQKALLLLRRKPSMIGIFLFGG